MQRAGGLPFPDQAVPGYPTGSLLTGSVVLPAGFATMNSSAASSAYSSPGAAFGSGSATPLDLQSDFGDDDQRSGSSASESDDPQSTAGGAGVSHAGADGAGAGAHLGGLDAAAQARRRRRSETPSTLEQRRLRRLERNRISAQMSRQRKKELFSTMFGEVAHLRDEKLKLETLLAQLLYENDQLRQQLLAITRRSDLM